MKESYSTVAAPVLPNVSFEPRRALNAELGTSFTMVLELQASCSRGNPHGSVVARNHVVGLDTSDHREQVYSNDIREISDDEAYGDHPKAFFKRLMLQNLVRGITR